MDRNGKQRPPTRKGAATSISDGNQNSTGEQFGSPVERVLECLERVRRSGRGWAALCPAHDDRWPSLSIAEGRDGRVLLHDHAGCSVEKITGALGLQVSDLFVDDRRYIALPPRSTRRHPLPRRVALALLDRPALALEWEVAKIMARVPEPLARQDLLASWDALADRVDIPFVIALSRSLRGIAVLRYGSASDLYGAPARAADALMREAA